MSTHSTSYAGLVEARSSAVDAVRGFALFGVVMVNAPFFAFPVTAFPEPSTVTDWFALWSVMAFATGKFFLVFSFLFGFGFTVLLERSEARGGGVDYRYLRRLIGLLVLGAAHAIFLFLGDILVLYAVLGLVLWFLRGQSDRVLLGLAGVSMLIAIPAQTLILTADFSEVGAGPSNAVEPAMGYLGTFWDAAAHRVHELPLGATVVGLFNGPSAFAMFVLGFVLTRRGVFPLGAERCRRLRTPALVAFGVAGTGSAAAAAVLVGSNAQPGWEKVAAGATSSLLAPALSFALVVALSSFAVRVPESRVVKALAVVGGSSLSGYLLHSVLLGAVFFGWGLGLYDRLNPSGVLAISLVVYSMIIAVLRAWTQWFRYGPAEWLLRSFIDLRWKPLLRTALPAPSRADSLAR